MSQVKDIEKYHVVFPLWEGPYFEIFRVEDSQKNKFFLKLINIAKLKELQFANAEEYRISEIEIMRGLSHANIMRLVDDGETIVNGQRYSYWVSNFVAGELLADNNSRKGITTVYDMKVIVTGILNALKYLHSLPDPVIYNGISPKGIILNLSSGSPVPMLSDFGHAQILNKENRKCFIDGLSPFYLAPEMFKGLFSTRTDLYSVGALMYHLVYGIQPWQIDLKKIPEKERIQAVLSARKAPLPIPNIRTLEVNDELLSIMAKALSQDVDERFQNADEFLKALSGETHIDCSNYEKVELHTEKDDKEKKPKFEKKGKGFDDVAGMDELKKRLREEVIDLLKNPDKYKKLRVQIPNGILLYGPPGCGKTFIGEKFAEELGCNYMYIHCSDVASPYIHGGQEKIAGIFQQARENAPTVLFLDELDAMLADRSRHNNVSESGEVNEFLTQLNNCGENGVIVVGATNNPTVLDSAALRSGRFDIKVYVPAPSVDEREQILRLVLKGIAADDMDYKQLAIRTDGYVSKDICMLVNRAARITGRQDEDKIKMLTLLEEIEKSKGELPSVSETDLRKHEMIRDQFESRKDSRRIGFKTSKEE